MSAIQQAPLPAWAETQVNVKPAWTEVLLNKPVTRLFYRISRAGYPMLPLQHEVEIDLYPPGYQRVSLVRGPRTWAKVRERLEDQERIEDVILIERDFIARYGDCLEEYEG